MTVVVLDASSRVSSRLDLSPSTIISSISYFRRMQRIGHAILAARLLLDVRACADRSYQGDLCLHLEDGTSSESQELEHVSASMSECTSILYKWIFPLNLDSLFCSARRDRRECERCHWSHAFQWTSVISRHGLSLWVGDSVYNSAGLDI